MRISYLKNARPTGGFERSSVLRFQNMPPDSRPGSAYCYYA